MKNGELWTAGGRYLAERRRCPASLGHCTLTETSLSGQARVDGVGHEEKWDPVLRHGSI